MTKIDVGTAGYVELVDWMGRDTSVAEAARVCSGSASQGTRGLLRYLMRKGHMGPFEMCTVKLRVKVPMDIWRQWVRHRTASINERSTRYSAIEPEFASPEGEWRGEGGPNGPVSEIPLADIAEDGALAVASECYQDLLGMGVAREQARAVLPLATYTEAIWCCDLRNILHFLELRLAPGAQQEIREYAQAIAGIVKDLFPLTWEAFVDYRLEALTLSRLEVSALGGSMVALAKMSRGEQEDFRDKRLPLGSLVGSWLDDSVYNPDGSAKVYPEMPPAVQPPVEGQPRVPAYLTPQWRRGLAPPTMAQFQDMGRDRAADYGPMLCPPDPELPAKGAKTVLCNLREGGTPTVRGSDLFRAGSGAGDGL